MKKIVFNSVICLNCGEQLISRHRHDYKECSCENKTMVDGGYDYERFGGKDLELVQSFVIYSDDPHETIRRYVERGSRGKSGREDLKYIKLKDIDDEYLQNIINYEETYRPDNPFIKIYKNEQKWRKKKTRVI